MTLHPATRRPQHHSWSGSVGLTRLYGLSDGVCPRQRSDNMTSIRSVCQKPSYPGAARHFQFNVGVDNAKPYTALVVSGTVHRCHVLSFSMSWMPLSPPALTEIQFLGPSGSGNSAIVCVGPLGKGAGPRSDPSAACPPSRRPPVAPNRSPRRSRFCASATLAFPQQMTRYPATGVAQHHSWSGSVGSARLYCLGDDVQA